MVPTLKSEFRKLFTVRSTYLITFLIIVLSCLFTYLGTAAEYVDNQPNGKPGDSKSADQGTRQPAPPQKTKNLQPEKLAANIIDASGAAIFISVVVVLLMAHEFRYNTITYTLTSSNSRSRVLLAKLIVGITYTVAAALLAMAVTVAVTYLAVHIKGLNLPPQNIDWLYIGGRLVGYILGFALIGLAIITLVRNITAAIVALFLLPTLDSLLGLILTKNNIEPIKYLPFSALSRLITGVGGSTPASMPTVLHAAAVFLIYLAAFWLAAWFLFLRRDAN